MKIDKKFFEQLTGSLSEDKIKNKSKTFGNIFNIINKINPDDKKIDIEEITLFAASVWQEDDGDGKISDAEIESYMQKNQTDFADTGIRAKDIRKFLEFFIKHSDKSPDNTRVDNGDGTYSVITQNEVFEEQRVAVNQNEIDEWEANHRNQQDNIPPVRDNNTDDEDSGEIGFSKKGGGSKSQSSEGKPEPLYETKLVSKGTVTRKVNYNSNNQIISVEETEGNVTTITDAEGKILRTVTRNEGAKDTIREYTTLDDGTVEESIFYGDNGVKDSSEPVYKKVYRNNSLAAKYEYDLDGRILQRQNIKDGVVYSVTKYNNGVEAETVELFTNTHSYTNPYNIFDNIIDPTKQGDTGDCWLLNGISMLSRSQWGRQAIQDAISYDTETGNITVRFKHAYGETKEFTITPQELSDAQQEIYFSNYSFSVHAGDIVYIDGREELRITEDTDLNFRDNKVRENITIVDRNGNRRVLTKEDLEANATGFSYDKYSTGDLTVLAIELAVEKSRQEAGIPLELGWGLEVIAMFTDTSEVLSYENSALNKNLRSRSIQTNSQREEDKFITENSSKIFSHINKIEETNLSAEQMENKLRELIDDSDKYIIEIDFGGHCGEILGFEEVNGEIYVIYTHPTDNLAETREELSNFCQNTLAGLTIVRKGAEPEIFDNSDARAGDFSIGHKSNRTAFTAAISVLSQNSDFKPDIQREGNNFTVTIKGEKIIITPNELETARISGNFTTKDDDVTLLELAVFRYINRAWHGDKPWRESGHTDLDRILLTDILNLFTDGKLESQKVNGLKEANEQEGLKYAVSEVRDEQQDSCVRTYYAIKEIKQAPDGKYLISVIQPEDTSIVITYTEEEFRERFKHVEIFH